VAGDLGGLTLPPGLYNSTTTLGITGNLKLDGGGNPYSVFIFQVGSTLTTASGSQVILQNGANAANIFWQVGSSATLGTYSAFNGTILAQTSITLTTGAQLNGRALAGSGAVTLDSNTITNPGPPVTAPPMALTCAVATGQMGVAYNSSLAATGGAGGYVFSIASGYLPAGLTLNASTGAITGTPTAYGTSSFTAKVVDSTGTAAGTTTSSCSIVVAPPIALTCAVATGQMGVAYNSSLAATGGAGGYVFSIASGSLPAGLTLNASSGAITGTPTAYGTSSFTAKVVDSTGTTAGTTTSSCSIVVAPPIALTCAVATGQMGVAYNSSLAATGGAGGYVFSIASGSLPAGLTLNASSGAITGTPTAYGTSSFTAKVVDSTGTTAGTTTSSCSIVVAPPIALTCAVATGQMGVAYNSSLAATGGAGGYVFSIASGSLPAGLTLNASTGAITGTPTAYGTSNFTAKVVDSTGTTAGTTTSGCSIVVAPPIALTCAVATGQMGVAYNSSLAATGGAGGYVFSIASGSLPAGLTLNASTGAITGTPTAYGTSSFTAKVVDSTGTTAGTTISSCSIVVAPPIALTCAAATGQMGVAYSSSLAATGGAGGYVFSIASGSLPAGLTLNASTGAITGTPTAYGTSSFTAKVVDSTGTTAGTTTSSCSIVVAPPIALTCAAATGQMGVGYNSSLAATGGAGGYVFSIASGSLPAGLTLNASTGAITGIPTAYGTSSFTAKVVDSTGTAAGTTTSSCSIVVAPPIALTCAVATGQMGVAYNSSLAATGGAGGYVFSIASGSLPAGLTLNASTGAITGTPTAYGTSSFTAKVVDSTGTTAGTTISSCSIVVAPPIALTCAAATGQMGVAYSSSLAATGGAGGYVFSIASGSLPAGLTLNASTGAITGTPTAYGTSNFTAKVVDSTGTTAGTTTSSCSIVVAPPIALTCAVATGQMGVAYNSSLAATGGAGGYVFSIASGSLPAGLTLNASTGAITGTPTAYGTSSFTAKVVDSTGTTAGTTTSSCSIVVAPPIALTCAVATGQMGVAYSSSLAATGGAGGYVFSIASGSLPAGLTLNASTGAITGTPTAAGISFFTSKAHDSTSGDVTNNCSITVVATQADVSITNSGPATVAWPANITYSIVVANAGPSPAASVTVTDVLPTGTSL
jgi:uncharacterized repeat protein (TIGR01451 family)